jgi:Holliday junction resolvase RusA-like endonuclease
MKIILPLPPSDNERLIIAWNQRRMIASKKYRDYKKIVEKIVFPLIMEQYRVVGTVFNPTFENQLTINIKFYLKDKRRDATDMLKCLLDALKDILYPDDKWVVPLIHYPYFIDKDNPRLEITI